VTDSINGTVVKLSKPVQALTERIGSVTLREPTGGDLTEAGYPTKFDDKGKTEIDARAMTKLIARLAGVPETTVRDMAARDWNTCALTVAGFLGTGAAASD
jgi:hypothetical protein